MSQPGPDLDTLIREARGTRPPPGALAGLARRLGISMVVGGVVALFPQAAAAQIKPLVAGSALRGIALAAGLGTSGVVTAVVLMDRAEVPAPLVVAQAPAAPKPALVKAQPAPESVAPVGSEPPVAESKPAPARPVTATNPAWDEPALIEKARRALASDPKQALALSREHQRRFPAGVLSAEREVIAIEAAARLGSASDAMARADAFEKRFPQSIHLPRIRALRARLASEP
jgi:hypothetical protein